MRGRGGFEMNVVLLPALASITIASAGTDSVLCFEGTCLLGWIWSILALTLLSAWIVQRWNAGSMFAARLAPVAVGIASQSCSTPDLSRRTDLVAESRASRAPPTTDMA